jgi:hypothetical protein
MQAAWLVAHNTNGETWDLVVTNSQVGSGLLADEDVPVMSLGGFMGTDQTISLSHFADLVAAGKVRYVYTGSRGGIGGLGGASSTIVRAVEQSCPAVTDAPAGYTGSIYDCAGQADALRQLA